MLTVQILNHGRRNLFDYRPFKNAIDDDELRSFDRKTRPLSKNARHPDLAQWLELHIQPLTAHALHHSRELAQQNLKLLHQLRERWLRKKLHLLHQDSRPLLSKHCCSSHLIVRVADYDKVCDCARVEALKLQEGLQLPLQAAPRKELRVLLPSVDHRNLLHDWKQQWEESRRALLYPAILRVGHYGHWAQALRKLNQAESQLPQNCKLFRVNSRGPLLQF
mmetsp:Transcript_9289/g.20663  ORF Transcript_9289/g.20663 Transcript_9289/m.20663 type:complete len:221 (-) Transcript_9289:261-923(-)